MVAPSLNNDTVDNMFREFRLFWVHVIKGDHVKKRVNLFNYYRYSFRVLLHFYKIKRGFQLITKLTDKALEADNQDYLSLRIAYDFFYKVSGKRDFFAHFINHEKSGKLIVRYVSDISDYQLSTAEKYTAILDKALEKYRKPTFKTGSYLKQVSEKDLWEKRNKGYALLA